MPNAQHPREAGHESNVLAETFRPAPEGFLRLRHAGASLARVLVVARGDGTIVRPAW